MKIRDLDLDQYVIVYDIGKSEGNNGMTVVGRVEEIVFHDDGENAATINSLGNLYDITDDNYFDLWTKSIEDKTEHIGFDKENMEKSRKLLSNDVQQKKRFEHLKGNFNKEKTSDRVFEGWAKDLHEDRKNIEDNFDKLHQKRYENKSNDVSDNQQDVVNKPSHYTYGKIEIIDIVEQVTAAYPTNIAFSIGNALKYICRAPFKNGVEDLKKAVWYLNRCIEKWDVNKEETK